MVLEIEKLAEILIRTRVIATQRRPRERSIRVQETDVDDASSPHSGRFGPIVPTCRSGVSGGGFRERPDTTTTHGLLDCHADYRTEERPDGAGQDPSPLDAGSHREIAMGW